MRPQNKLNSWFATQALPFITQKNIIAFFFLLQNEPQSSAIERRTSTWAIVDDDVWLCCWRTFTLPQTKFHFVHFKCAECCSRTKYQSSILWIRIVLHPIWFYFPRFEWPNSGHLLFRKIFSIFGVTNITAQKKNALKEMEQMDTNHSINQASVQLTIYKDSLQLRNMIIGGMKPFWSDSIRITELLSDEKDNFIYNFWSELSMDALPIKEFNINYHLSFRHDFHTLI